MISPVVIVGAARTPIGKFLGSLASVPAPLLGAPIVRELLHRSNLEPKEVDEVIMGNVLQAGLGQNPARQVAIFGGIPNNIPSFTVNKVCGSGMKAVILGSQSLMLRESKLVLAGGIENMSRAPYLLTQHRGGSKYGNDKLIDSMIHDGLWCIFNDEHMGCITELLVEKYSISREEQDAFALDSHRKAIDAIKSGAFRDEIVPIPVGEGQLKKTLEIDETPRLDTAPGKLARLKPFKQMEKLSKIGREEQPCSITAGNASSLSDGGACLLLTTKEHAGKLGLEPLCKVDGWATAALDPKYFGLAPSLAVRGLLRKVKRRIDEFGLIEINEAFAAQTISVQRELRIEEERLNVNGGAIALGHPIGASGARILVTLIHAMGRRGVELGLATICIGGGQALAVALSRP